MIVIQGRDKSRRYDRVAFLPDGDGVAALSGGVFTRWRVDGSNESVTELHLAHEGTSLAIGGGRFFVGTITGVQTISPPGWVPEKLLGVWPVRCIAAASDGAQVLAGGGPDGRPRLELWTGRGVVALPASGIPVGVAFLPDGRMATLECPPWDTADDLDAPVESTVRLRRPSGEVEATAYSPLISVESLAVSPDGARAVVVARTSLLLYDLTDPDRPPIKVVNRTRKHFMGAAYHPSGRFFAAAANDAVVTYFDAETGAEVGAFNWTGRRMRSVAFSPDGTLAAAGGDGGRVVVWDVEA